MILKLKQKYNAYLQAVLQAERNKSFLRQDESAEHAILSMLQHESLVHLCCVSYTEGPCEWKMLSVQQRVLIRLSYWTTSRSKMLCFNWTEIGQYWCWDGNKLLNITTTQLFLLHWKTRSQYCKRFQEPVAYWFHLECVIFLHKAKECKHPQR